MENNKDKNMSDVEIVQHVFKVSAEIAQEMLNKGVDVDFLRNPGDFIQNAIMENFEGVIKKTQTELNNILNDFKSDKN